MEKAEVWAEIKQNEGWQSASLSSAVVLGSEDNGENVPLRSEEVPETVRCI